MKTKPMAHQKEGLRRMEGKRNFALFMEMGTGKTWTALADAERAYAAGKIDAVLVVAPKGVHINWVEREIPEHMEGEIIARYWTKTGGKAGRKHLEEIFTPRAEGGVVPLRVFAINIDAINTKDGYTFAERFLRATRAIMIVDESSRIKNPDAKRTDRVVALGRLATARRILTGTPITNRPTDVFMQMEFLRSGMLGTTSYRAFVAEYTELMSNDHPLMRNMIQSNPRAAFAQVPRKDEMGRPIYKNLDKLQALLEPHSYRVLKSECLDLPEKIYRTQHFELTPAQLKVYQHLERQSRIVLEDGTISAVNRLAALAKLQQVTSGYVVVPVPGQEPEMRFVGEANPRLEALMELVEDFEDDAQCIVWARFRPEVEAIVARLKAAGKVVVEYHGGVDEVGRKAAINAFQHERTAQFFVGTQQAGGIGLTLTAAEQMIYYSNSFDLELRLQSEDRAHRIGQRKNVVYTDLAAVGTIDRIIARALQRKKDVAAEVLGDLKAPKRAIINVN